MDPSEEDMRQQMFKTMVALEKAANAATAYFEAITPVPVAEPQSFTDFKCVRCTEKATTRDSQGLSVCEEHAKQPKTPTDDELKQMGKVIAKHHQALGLIATFGEFKDAGFGFQPPRGKITSLLGMRSCSDCVGTGWLARDETCKSCGSTGYIKA